MLAECSPDSREISGRLKSTTVLTEIVGMAVGRDLMSGMPT